MEIGGYGLMWVCVIFTLMFGMLDLTKNGSANQNIFNSIRYANQNALYDVQPDYESRETLTSAQMLEVWLEEFAQNADMEYNDIVLNFAQIETEPPLYLVYAKGYKDQYRILTAEAYYEFLNGSTILQKEPEN